LTEYRNVTDGQTDKHNCCINIVRQCADKKTIKRIPYTVQLRQTVTKLFVLYSYSYRLVRSSDVVNLTDAVGTITHALTAGSFARGKHLLFGRRWDNALSVCCRPIPVAMDSVIEESMR